MSKKTNPEEGNKNGEKEKEKEKGNPKASERPEVLDPAEFGKQPPKPPPKAPGVPKPDKDGMVDFNCQGALIIINGEQIPQKCKVRKDSYHDLCQMRARHLQEKENAASELRS